MSTLVSDSAAARSERGWRVWVLEDHDAIRQLLAEFVTIQPGLAIAGATAQDAPLLEACRAGAVDLVLLDLMLNGRGGLKVLEEMSQLPARPKVIVFSAVVTVHSVQTALNLGADGYVEKAAPISELQRAIKRVTQGGIYLSEHVSAIARHLIEQRGRGRDASALSPRELRVLELVARGMNAKALALTLELSEPATYRLKSQVAAKLDAHSDQELTLIAVRMGLISPLEDMAEAKGG